MTRAMRAVIFHGPRDVRLEEVPLPAPGPGEVVLRVGAALTCGTDFKAYRQGHKVLLGEPPAPFGHEAAGVVEAVGPGAAAFRPGMRVVAANSAPCGSEDCFFCRRGQPQLCDDLKLHNGAYAEYLRVPARIVRANLYELPAGLPFESAALCEPLACAVHGVDALGVEAGETAAVLGAGVMARLLLGALKARGARVLVVGRGREALKEAERLGADETVSALDRDPLEAARRFGAGRGPDCVFEAVGRPETWTQAVAMARKGGRVCLFGGCAQGTQAPVDAHKVHYGQLSLFGVFHHTPRYFQEALRLLSEGRVDARAFIGFEIGLSEVPSFFERHHDRSVLKAAVKP